MNEEIQHNELCQIAAKLIKRHGIGWRKPKYIVVEIELAGFEQPDIYCFGGERSIMIEVKVSRSDFLADKKKWHRQHPENGVGECRYYLCPYQLISVDELPEKWGLLYYKDNKIEVIKNPERQQSNTHSELAIVSSVLRREGFYNKIFSYKNYKSQGI
uniref:hypothetical protein n=1 Tax=uncultured Dysgonomonas sp. TaxID=206096 RepID=UPI00263536F5|nr:hypothetical protein [uncultured Dysgonomonas sp.]